MKRKMRVFLPLGIFLVGIAAFATSSFFDLTQSKVYFKEKTEAVGLECATPASGSDGSNENTWSLNPIVGWAEPTSRGYFITDVISYQVVIFFCSEIEVDEEYLIRGMDLSPFEMKQEPKISRGFSRDRSYKALLLTYAIQAIGVSPGEEYSFAHIPVGYSHIGGDTRKEVYWIRDVEPIYISRLAPYESVVESIEGNKMLEFQPLKPEIGVKEGAVSAKWFVVLGSAFVIFGLGGIIYPVARRINAKSRVPKDEYGEEILEILRGIRVLAESNARESVHRLHNLILDISKDARGQYQAIINKMRISTDLLAHREVAPSFEEAIEAIDGARVSWSEWRRVENRKYRQAQKIRKGR